MELKKEDEEVRIGEAREREEGRRICLRRGRGDLGECLWVGFGREGEEEKGVELGEVGIHLLNLLLDPKRRTKRTEENTESVEVLECMRFKRGKGGGGETWPGKVGLSSSSLLCLLP